MNLKRTSVKTLEDVKIKLAALWAATMFCYLYADILSLFRAGMIEQIIAGEVSGFEINRAFLLGSAILMSIPTMMVVLSLILNPVANRYTNIILGGVHICIAIATTLMPGTGAYYRNPI
ncbi:DUF6326 family protein [Vacuolonema iberomarrocanum]|uniref:DUF6326 family protein n=1 Tax=Vacuolonema iberomarrocanum TaxID=3454632 RepID=UPI0019DDE09A|nr:hypothetical protein [filamentous cyanobacterium LEGE 07170]